VAILDFGGKLDLQTVKDDFAALGAPMPQVYFWDVPGLSDSQDGKSTLEAQLDIQVIGDICRDAIITVYRGKGSADLVTMFNKAVEDKNGVISISWGWDETVVDPYCYTCSLGRPMQEALNNAKKAGVTVCAATGDAGSSNYSEGTEALPAPDELAHLQYPASHPQVLAVGGTQLMADEDNSEWVWNNTQNPEWPQSGATGGGVSYTFDIPSYQKDAGIDIPNVNNGWSGRVLPDVAGIAATGDWAIGIDGKLGYVGGTSAPCPMWAALITRANEHRAHIGKCTVGFINPSIYKQPDGLFTDIVIGDNKPTPSYPGYEARPGFDACTGWGVPRGNNVCDLLVSLP
jgi:kumamolisin